MLHKSILSTHLFFFIAVISTLACERSPGIGYLQVKAVAKGDFEIYRVAAESPLQLVSEEIGQYSTDVPLEPGRYLVLADCSSSIVTIYPGQTERLLAHRVSFTPPRVPVKADGFSIQCNRATAARSRQNLTGRYQLDVIEGQRDFLIGMVPFAISLEGASTLREPRTYEYSLAALQVSTGGQEHIEGSYFISPVDELLSATKPQNFGSWDYLLPGTYRIEINGTKLEVALQAGQQKIVDPAFIKISTPPGVNLDKASQIVGTPQLVVVNNNHFLDFNTIYPVLPGDATFNVSGSTKRTTVTTVAKEALDLAARSVTVNMDCPIDNLDCLGAKDIALYKQDQPYPFLESVTDIPVLFVQDNAEVLVGIEGSRDIKVQLSSTALEETLAIGYLEIVPKPSVKQGFLTDLVRVEANSESTTGHTLDVDLERPTKMPLVSGTYSLAHYLSSTLAEGERQQQLRTVKIEAGKVKTVELPVYFRERRFAAYQKKVQDRQDQSQKNL